MEQLLSPTPYNCRQIIGTRLTVVAFSTLLISIANRSRKYRNDHVLKTISFKQTAFCKIKTKLRCQAVVNVFGSLSHYQENKNNFLLIRACCDQNDRLKVRQCLL